jgi:hypothetical protein
MTSTETTTEYVIEDGQRALFYDVTKTCGPMKLTSEDFIRILTPSIKCHATTEFQYIFGVQTAPPNKPAFLGNQTFTFFGYGLEIVDDTFVSPLERGVNWAAISFGVKEKFTQSVDLADEIHLGNGGFDFKRAPDALWGRATNAIRYNYTFDLAWPYNYR